MRDVIGYEEKDPEILKHLSSGYPRFVVHPYVVQLARHLGDTLGLGGRTLWLASSARAADGLLAYLGSGERISHEGLQGVVHPTQADLYARAKSYLQHTGSFLSSREAEDHLVRLGLLTAATEEAPGPADARGAVNAVLRQAYPSAGDNDLLLTHTGMSACHAAWHAISDLQAGRGRTVWIQLGWLYLDTNALLRKFAGRTEDFVYLADVHDLAALERALEKHAGRVAGIVTETPTNPLVQTPDVPGLAALASRHGARVILDPTYVSPFNVDVLAHADIVVNSLTKYAANEGDLIAGVIVINPAGPDAAALREACATLAEPLYTRDLGRLSAQIGDYQSVIAHTNASTPPVVAFLQNHPKVRDVFWTLQPASRDNYLKIARSPAHVGSMISFTLHGQLADFYDRVRLPKGPSFGMKTTLLCPFIYLAHYDLVTSETGRAELAASGLNPELLRLALGCEPVDDIIATLKEALDGS
jgi:cystathionine gamma-synthase